jgi:CheY-like chemotaxis protein
MNTDNLLLLVEDDGVIRAVLEIELREAGFGVVVASTGTQAPAELNADANSVQCHHHRYQTRFGPGRLGYGVGSDASEFPICRLSISVATAHTLDVEGRFRQCVCG